MIATNTMFINPFCRHTTEMLLKKKAHYEKIIAEQQPDYVAPVSKTTGKRMVPAQMPWMLPHWEKGLAMLNEELKERLS